METFKKPGRKQVKSVGGASEVVGRIRATRKCTQAEGPSSAGELAEHLQKKLTSLASSGRTPRVLRLH